MKGEFLDYAYKNQQLGAYLPVTLADRPPKTAVRHAAGALSRGAVHPDPVAIIRGLRCRRFWGTPARARLRAEDLGAVLDGWGSATATEAGDESSCCIVLFCCFFFFFFFSLLLSVGEDG